MKLLTTNFSQRLAVATIGIPIVALIIVGGLLPLFLFIYLLAIISLFEISKMLSNVNLRLFPSLFIPLALLIVYFVSQAEPYMRNLVVFNTIIVSILAIVVMYANLFHLNKFLKNVFITLIATLVISVPLSFAILIYQLPLGVQLLATVVFGIFSFDTGAYVFGTILGKNKMAPRISPGKTWEGAFFGTIICLVTVGILDMIFGLNLNKLALTLVAFSIACFGQIGDLVESYFKRRTKSKDSSKLLPGHGGFLDRIDSIIIVLPTIYYGLLLWV